MSASQIGDSEMMTDSADPAKAAKAAQKIVDILINENLVIRQRAIQAAMLLLGAATPRSANVHPLSLDDEHNKNQADLASFFNREDELKPADYAHLCAAYHFSQFGSVPFSIAEIREIATNAGVVIPDRLDMTFGSATKKGKKLYQSPSKGSFRPTAAGGLEFGDRWNVKPGRKAKSLLTAKGNGAADAAVG
jgi:hypothetical protein